jgi:exonuclease SbcD
MKIVHTADLHIGMELHGPMNPTTGLARRLEDFLASLDRIVDAAIAERADLVIMAGDIYKGRDPTPTHQREFAKRVMRLTRESIPLVLLAGNHDLPNAENRATSIDIFRALDVAGVRVARAVDVERIDTPAGPVLVATLPWVPRSTLLTRALARGAPMEEIEREMVGLIANTVDELAGLVEGMRADPALAQAPAILVAHVHAQEARDGAERLLTVGTDPLIPIERLALQAFDYVALGHIHAHQVLMRHPAAVYPGSIERVSFGEEREAKGYVLAEVGRGSCEWQFVELPARTYVTIKAEALADDPTDHVLRRIERRRAELPDAVVRVIARVSPQNQALFDEIRIRRALADAFWVQEIRREVDHPARARLAGMTVEGKTPLELLEDYFVQKQVPTDERARLRNYAVRLLQQVGSEPVTP